MVPFGQSTGSSSMADLIVAGRFSISVKSD
jgi:hypothetical protein